MIHVLKVLTPGLHTTFQDIGRIGYRNVGVPASGPLDRISLRLANVLVGNRADTPVLEILMSGPALEVLADSIRVALTGCHATIEVTSRSGRRRRVPAGRSARLTRGDVLQVPVTGDSLCGYLAIEGGVAVPRVLGSTATYVRGGFGGHHGRRLQSHDILMLRRTSVAAEGESALPQVQKLDFDQPIRVVPGPQQDHFTDQALKTLLSSEYTVSRQSDRMGFRLDGPSLEHSGDYNIVSDGIASGSIQVPGTGQPILLMVDNQTTGGYPKIATVISADIPVVGRRKPGQRLRFEAVDVADAEAIRRSQEVQLEREAASILRAVEDVIHA